MVQVSSNEAISCLCSRSYMTNDQSSITKLSSCLYVIDSVENTLDVEVFDGDLRWVLIFLRCLE